MDKEHFHVLIRSSLMFMNNGDMRVIKHFIFFVDPLHD